MINPVPVKAPRISVVMSVFNSEAHLRESVESVLGQTLTDFEFIIVNDGSTDGSTEMLNKFAAADARVRIVLQENTGLTRALITGCRLARGEFIARQDDDDRSHFERFARQLAFLNQHPGVGFVGCATRYIGPMGEPLELVTRDSDPVIASRKLADERCGPPAHGGVMFRRALYEQVGGYRGEFYLGQDSDLWLRMIEHAQFACIPEESYYFRRHAASVSSRHRDAQQAFGWLSHDCRAARAEGLSEAPYLTRAQEVSDRVRAERRLSKSVAPDLELNYLLGSRLAQEGRAEARGYLWSVVRQRPWHWKAWVRLLQSYWGGWRSSALKHEPVKHEPVKHERGDEQP